jgi:hypothetical protein
MVKRDVEISETLRDAKEKHLNNNVLALQYLYRKCLEKIS